MQLRAEAEAQPATTGASKIAGKIKRGLKAFFAATNGGLSVYDVAGEAHVPATDLTKEAEDARRRAQKGKALAYVDEEESDCMSVDTAFSADQAQGQQASTKQRLRKLATAVLSSGPTLAEAIDHAVAPLPSAAAAADGGFPARLGGGSSTASSSLHSHRSSASSADLELATFGLPGGSGGGGSSSAWGAWGADAGPSGSGSGSGSGSSSAWAAPAQARYHSSAAGSSSGGGISYWAPPAPGAGGSSSGSGGSSIYWAPPSAGPSNSRHGMQ